jgi:Na+-transporting NADH:ubiquinone oxidoreductase subunit NqrA
LRWATLDNEADKIVHGMRRYGERHPSAKLDASIVLHIREQVLAGRRITDIAEHFGVNHATISLLVKGKNRRSLSRSRMQRDLDRVAEITA